MKTVDERANDILLNLSAVEPDLQWKDIIVAALKEQDDITRNECAKEINQAVCDVFGLRA